MQRHLQKSGLLLLSLLLLGAGPCAVLPVELGLPTPGGLLPLTITLPAGTDPATTTVSLDGVDVTSAFASGGPGLVGAVPLPDPGSHQLRVTRQVETIPGLPLPLTEGTRIASPAAAPALLSLEPSPAGGPLPRTAWLRARFASPVGATALAGWGFGLECDGQPVARDAFALDDGSVVVNPRPELPPGASCRMAWRGDDGAVAEAAFAVAADAGGAPGSVLYDRSDPLSLAPFPDDYWTEPDASQPSGRAIDMPVPPFGDAFQVQAFQALVQPVNAFDGWSQQTPIVIAFSHPLDPAATPADAFASQDPMAPIALVDVDPASPSYGKRIPYHMTVRSDPRPGGGLDHAAILFPTVDLREHGRYAVVVTRRAFAAGEPGRPFGPSSAFAAVLGDPQAGEAPEITRARARLAPALDVLAALPDVPIPSEDVALAVSLSIRTRPSVADLVYLKELALASPPPELVLPDIASDPCPDPASFCVSLSSARGLVVRGRVRLPDFRGPLGSFQRDSDGHPVQTAVHEVPMVVSLPREALDGPVFPVMYQHGNPGSPGEILGENANGQIDDAGLALVGIQDTLNREIGQDVALQVQVIFFFLIQSQHIPDYWNQTGSDMIFFLRAIQGMGSLDLMHADANGDPAIGPDGSPEIDPSTILYKGISEGANNAQRFLPFAPEILAAEATVGGARLGETLIHQSAGEILQQIGGFLPQLHPADLWVGLSLFQAGFDPQDGHTYLPYLYREPLLPFAGSSDVTPPSTIWTEGIGDSLVPNNASDAMAAAIGLPLVRPVVRSLPTLEEVDPPLASNIAPGITAGFFQFAPLLTPSCIAVGQLEPHYCAQIATEAKAQRLHFLLTALGGNPEIVDPF